MFLKTILHKIWDKLFIGDKLIDIIFESLFETFLPSVLAGVGVLLISKSEEKEMWLYTIIFCLVSMIYIGFLVWYKAMEKKRGGLSLMDLRHAALAKRRYFTTRAQGMADLTTPQQNDPIRLEEDFYELLNFPTGVNECLRALFLLFSEQNANLDKHFWITLMEPKPKNETDLHITYFANSEGKRPRSMCEGRVFKKFRSCAGWAWYYKEIYTIPNVSTRIDELIHAPLDNPDWDFHQSFPRSKKDSWEPNKNKIGSITSIPVVVRSVNGSNVRAIVNIACDLKYHFRQPAGALKTIRIKSEPFITHLAFLYELNDILEATNSRPTTENTPT